MSNTRKEGYYWVRPILQPWLIAYFGRNGQYEWHIPFLIGTYSDDAFQEINERRLDFPLLKEL